ncbi:MAG: hypothetical protein K4445_09020 [Deltaproteobacteria bacterium]
MGICFSEASRCSDVSSLPKNNKSLRCILYLKNFFIDDNVVAVNSALEVDLSGQIAADTIGYRQYSGTGGQADFVRGAAWSNGGRSIIALYSTAAEGKISRIRSHITEGAAVVTNRADVHYVVTEYGVADLRGKSVAERAGALMAIAHPDFRDGLKEEYRRTRGK